MTMADHKPITPEELAAIEKGADIAGHWTAPHLIAEVRRLRECAEKEETAWGEKVAELETEISKRIKGSNVLVQTAEDTLDRNRELVARAEKYQRKFEQSRQWERSYTALLRQHEEMRDERDKLRAELARLREACGACSDYRCDCTCHDAITATEPEGE